MTAIIGIIEAQPAAHGGAELVVVSAVESDQGAGRAQFLMEGKPMVSAPKITLALPQQEQVGLGASHNQELSLEDFQLKQRPKIVVLLSEKADQAVAHLQTVTQQRQPCHLRPAAALPDDDSPHSLGIGGGYHRYGVGHRAAQLVEAGVKADLLADFLIFFVSKYAQEDPAGVDQSDEGGVTGSGQLGVEQNSHHAQMDFLLGFAGSDGIASGAGYESRQGEQAAAVDLQDTLLHQARRCLLTQFVGPVGQPSHPEFGSCGFRAGGYFPGQVGKDRIQQVVAQGRRINDGQRGRIRIDAIGQPQLQ